MKDEDVSKGHFYNNKLDGHKLGRLSQTAGHRSGERVGQ